MSAFDFAQAAVYEYWSLSTRLPDGQGAEAKILHITTFNQKSEVIIVSITP